MGDDVQRTYPGPLHPQRTRLHNLEYFFYDKHHKLGPSNDAQWVSLDEMTRVQEFEVFDLADSRQLSDAANNLYGMRPRDGDVVLTLGTRGEQIAKFPRARLPEAWHGFPVWPIKVSRDDEQSRPTPDEALVKMVGAEVISATERRRLRAGKHI